ncbi:MAG: MFS transporter [Promethearchaeota archaeon]
MSSILQQGALGYWQRIRQFTPNSRKLIASNVTRSFGGGISQTLFNLFLISLGYSKTFIGGFMAFGAFSMAIFSLFLGPYVTRVGSKNALILAILISFCTGTSQVGFPLAIVLLMTSGLQGISSALTNVAFSPIMTENSTPYERTHLFGTSQSFSILSSFLGNILAGYLPGWIALTFFFPIDSAPSFQLALIAYIVPIIISIVPLIGVTELGNKTINNSITNSTMNNITQTSQVTQEPKGQINLVLKFAIVNVFIGLGAGFVVPYLNVFFWEFYALPTPIIGIIQGLGSLTLSAGVFLSPVLSTRIGKVRTVVLCQALSLPFLVLIAIIINPFIAIICYLFRGVLMNATGPVDRTLRMELVPSNWRPNMSAVTGFSWNFPWAISTQLTGLLYDQGAYLIPFWFTLSCYSFSTLLYAIFFHNIEQHPSQNKDEKNRVTKPQ